MTTEARVAIVREWGFTERQARFLVLVMRHAGVCVPRQYARFAGLPHGGKTCNAFFEKLSGRGYAVASGCVHNRARLYHVHHKPLYRSIGEPESRYRRPVPAGRAVERLMLLDAVLSSPNLEWLTTASEKAAYFKTGAAGALAGDPTAEAPERSPSVRAETFPGTFPIGIDPSGRVVLLYLATTPWADDFRTFLHGHAAWLRTVPTWTLRLVFPRSLDLAYDRYQTVVREEVETPLHRVTISELTWYFQHRRKAADERPDQMTQAFLDRGAEVFGGPRFALLYRRWLKHGDAVFEGLSSPALAEALSTGAGRVECVVLPYSYRHLSPLVTRVRSASESGSRRGRATGASRPAQEAFAPPVGLS